MADAPNGDPKVQRYRIDNLFQAIRDVQSDQKEAFAGLEKKLDARLESHLRRWHDHDERIRRLENKAAAQMVINAILGALGGAALALVIQVLA